MVISILGMGRYVPEQVLKNDDFTRFIETDDEWIRTRTGIIERPMAGWEPTWYMGKQAALRAIEAAGIDPAKIGLVISCTATSSVAASIVTFCADPADTSEITVFTA